MSLEQLSTEFFDWWWRANPTHATAVGIHEYDAELEQFDSASVASRIADMGEFLRAIDAYHPVNSDE